MKTEKVLAVLVSGGGTNMQSVLDAIADKKIHARVAAVISSNKDAYALTRAKNVGIPTYVCAKADFESVAKRDQRILQILQDCGADYVLLAGYLGIISPEIVAVYPDKIINIHPALLPAYGGKNYYGLNVHRAVVAAKEPFSGATVHFVNAGTDTGRIIAQKSVAVSPEDSPESLQEKILQKVEHVLLPRVVAALCDNQIRVKGNRVVLSEKARIALRKHSVVQSDKRRTVNQKRAAKTLQKLRKNGAAKLRK